MIAPPPKVRLSEKDRYRLARLKGLTGIQFNNVLCRWAFCLSIRVPGRPAHAPTDTALEIEWEIFAGEWPEIYLALLTERCHRDGLELTREWKPSAIPEPEGE